MLKLSLHLPKVSLRIEVVKRRGLASIKPLFPKLEDIKAVKTGSKISRFFRHVFEHKNIKKVLGTNLAVIAFLGSFVPAKADPTQAEQNVIAETNSPITTDSKNVVQYPVNTFYISQSYSFFHPGLDLAGPYGEEVRPVKDGVVEDIYRTSSINYGYGNAVIIDHGNGISSLYAHLSVIDVAKGDTVTAFTKIGELGNTGHATGPHVHLEIRNHGIPINPFAILPSPASAI